MFGAPAFQPADHLSLSTLSSQELHKKRNRSLFMEGNGNIHLCRHGETIPGPISRRTASASHSSGVPDHMVLVDYIHQLDTVLSKTGVHCVTSERLAANSSATVSAVIGYNVNTNNCGTEPCNGESAAQCDPRDDAAGDNHSQAFGGEDRVGADTRSADDAGERMSSFLCGFCVAGAMESCQPTPSPPQSEVNDSPSHSNPLQDNAININNQNEVESNEAEDGVPHQPRTTEARSTTIFHTATTSTIASQPGTTANGSAPSEIVHTQSGIQSGTSSNQQIVINSSSVIAVGAERNLNLTLAEHSNETLTNTSSDVVTAGRGRGRFPGRPAPSPHPPVVDFGLPDDIMDPQDDDPMDFVLAYDPGPPEAPRAAQQQRTASVAISSGPIVATASSSSIPVAMGPPDQERTNVTAVASSMSNPNVSVQSTVRTLRHTPGNDTVRSTIQSNPQAAPQSTNERQAETVNTRSQLEDDSSMALQSTVQSTAREVMNPYVCTIGLDPTGLDSHLHKVNNDDTTADSLLSTQVTYRSEVTTDAPESVVVGQVDDQVTRLTPESGSWRRAPPAGTQAIAVHGSDPQEVSTDQTKKEGSADINPSQSTQPSADIVEEDPELLATAERDFGSLSDPESSGPVISQRLRTEQDADALLEEVIQGKGDQTMGPNSVISTVGLAGLGEFKEEERVLDHDDTGPSEDLINVNAHLQSSSPRSPNGQADDQTSGYFWTTCPSTGLSNDELRDERATDHTSCGQDSYDTQGDLLASSPTSLHHSSSHGKEGNMQTNARGSGQSDISDIHSPVNDRVRSPLCDDKPFFNNIENSLTTPRSSPIISGVMVTNLTVDVDSSATCILGDNFASGEGINHPKFVIGDQQVTPTDDGSGSPFNLHHMLCDDTNGELKSTGHGAESDVDPWQSGDSTITVGRLAEDVTLQRKTPEAAVHHHKKSQLTCGYKCSAADTKLDPHAICLLGETHLYQQQHRPLFVSPADSDVDEHRDQLDRNKEKNDENGESTPFSCTPAGDDKVYEMNVIAQTVGANSETNEVRHCESSKESRYREIKRDTTLSNETKEEETCHEPLMDKNIDHISEVAILPKGAMQDERFIAHNCVGTEHPVGKIDDELVIQVMMDTNEKAFPLLSRENILTERSRELHCTARDFGIIEVETLPCDSLTREVETEEQTYLRLDESTDDGEFDNAKSQSDGNKYHDRFAHVENPQKDSNLLGNLESEGNIAKHFDVTGPFPDMFKRGSTNVTGMECELPGADIVEERDGWFEDGLTQESNTEEEIAECMAKLSENSEFESGHMEAAQGEELGNVHARLGDDLVNVLNIVHTDGTEQEKDEKVWSPACGKESKERHNEPDVNEYKVKNDEKLGCMLGSATLAAGYVLDDTTSQYHDSKLLCEQQDCEPGPHNSIAGDCTETGDACVDINEDYVAQADMSSSAECITDNSQESSAKLQLGTDLWEVASIRSEGYDDKADNSPPHSDAQSRPVGGHENQQLTSDEGNPDTEVANIERTDSCNGASGGYVKTAGTETEIHENCTKMPEDNLETVENHLKAADGCLVEVADSDVMTKDLPLNAEHCANTDGRPLATVDECVEPAESCQTLTDCYPDKVSDRYELPKNLTIFTGSDKVSSENHLGTSKGYEGYKNTADSCPHSARTTVENCLETDGCFTGWFGNDLKTVDEIHLNKDVNYHDKDETCLELAVECPYPVEDHVDTGQTEPCPHLSECSESLYKFPELAENCLEAAQTYIERNEGYQETAEYRLKDGHFSEDGGNCHVKTDYSNVTHGTISAEHLMETAEDTLESADSCHEAGLGVCHAAGHNHHKTADVCPQTADECFETSDLNCPETTDIFPKPGDTCPETMDIPDGLRDMSPDKKDICSVEVDTACTKNTDDSFKPTDIFGETDHVLPVTRDACPETATVDAETADICYVTDDIRPDTRDVCPETATDDAETADIYCDGTDEMRPDTRDVYPETATDDAETADIYCDGTDDIRPDTRDVCLEEGDDCFETAGICQEREDRQVPPTDNICSEADDICLEKVSNYFETIDVCNKRSDTCTKNVDICPVLSGNCQNIEIQDGKTTDIYNESAATCLKDTGPCPAAPEICREIVDICLERSEGVPGAYNICPETAGVTLEANVTCEAIDKTIDNDNETADISPEARKEKDTCSDHDHVHHERIENCPVTSKERDMCQETNVVYNQTPDICSERTDRTDICYETNDVNLETAEFCVDTTEGVGIPPNVNHDKRADICPGTGELFNTSPETGSASPAASIVCVNKVTYVADDIPDPHDVLGDLAKDFRDGEICSGTIVSWPNESYPCTNGDSLEVNCVSLEVNENDHEHAYDRPPLVGESPEMAGDETVTVESNFKRAENFPDTDLSRPSTETDDLPREENTNSRETGRISDIADNNNRETEKNTFDTNMEQDVSLLGATNCQEDVCRDQHTPDQENICCDSDWTSASKEVCRDFEIKDGTSLVKYTEEMGICTEGTWANVDIDKGCCDIANNSPRRPGNVTTNEPRSAKTTESLPLTAISEERDSETADVFQNNADAGRMCKEINQLFDEDAKVFSSGEGNTESATSVETGRPGDKEASFFYDMATDAEVKSGVCITTVEEAEVVSDMKGQSICDVNQFPTMLLENGETEINADPLVNTDAAGIGSDGAISSKNDLYFETGAVAKEVQESTGDYLATSKVPVKIANKIEVIRARQGNDDIGDMTKLIASNQAVYTDCMTEVTYVSSGYLPGSSFTWSHKTDCQSQNLSPRSTAGHSSTEMSSGPGDRTPLLHQPHPPKTLPTVSFTRQSVLSSGGRDIAHLSGQSLSEHSTGVTTSDPSQNETADNHISLSADHDARGDLSPVAKVILDTTDQWLNKISDFCRSPKLDGSDPDPWKLHLLADQCKSEIIAISKSNENNARMSPSPSRSYPQAIYQKPTSSEFTSTTPTVAFGDGRCDAETSSSCLPPLRTNILVPKPPPCQRGPRTSRIRPVLSKVPTEQSAKTNNGMARGDFLSSCQNCSADGDNVIPDSRKPKPRDNIPFRCSTQRAAIPIARKMSSVRTDSPMAGHEKANSRTHTDGQCVELSASGISPHTETPHNSDSDQGGIPSLVLPPPPEGQTDHMRSSTSSLPAISSVGDRASTPKCSAISMSICTKLDQASKGQTKHREPSGVRMMTGQARRERADIRPLTRSTKLDQPPVSILPQTIDPESSQQTQLKLQKFQSPKIAPSTKTKPTKMMTMREFERAQQDRHLTQAFARIQRSKACVDCHMDSRVMDRTGPSARRRRERVNYNCLIALENVKFLEMLRYKKSAYSREEQLKDFKKSYQTWVKLGKHTETWTQSRGLEKKKTEIKVADTSFLSKTRPDGGRGQVKQTAGYV